MAAANRFCSTKACPNPATSFFFSENAQVVVCPEHLPTNLKSYPVSQIFFLTSPDYEGELTRRISQVSAGKTYLNLVKARLAEEINDAVCALETELQQCIATATLAYQAEIRKVRQLGHQLEKRLQAFHSEFDDYIKERNRGLSALSKALVAENLPLPNLLHFVNWSVDLEVATLIQNSLYRSEDALESIFASTVDPAQIKSVAAALLKQSGEYGREKSLRSQKLALACCEESHRLHPTPDTTNLLNYLNRDIEATNSTRTAQIVTLYTRDITIIEKYISDYARMPHRQMAPNDLEDVQLSILDFALPWSKSKAVADLCSELGLSYQTHLGPRYHLAETWYLKALEIYKAHFQQSIETATAEFNLGSVYKAMNSIPQAKDHFNSALTILTTHFSTYRLTVKVYLAYAILHRDLDQYREAENYLEKALEIQRQHYASDPEIANTLLNYAYISERLQKYQRAEEQYKSAILILSKSQPMSPELARTYYSMGLLYKYRYYREDDARVALKMAINILQPSQFMSQLTALAIVEWADLPKTTWQEAEPLLIGAIPVLIQHYPKEITTVRALNQRASFCEQRQMMGDALNFRELALIHSQGINENCTLTAEMALALGKTCEKMKNWDAAESAYRVTLAVNRGKTEESEAWMEAEYRLGEVMLMMNRPEEATEQFCKALEMSEVCGNRKYKALCNAALGRAQT